MSCKIKPNDSTSLITPFGGWQYNVPLKPKVSSTPGPSRFPGVQIVVRHMKSLRDWVI